ncbi:MAG: hypothetical protein MUF64_02630 [Polyangiaceae bacterium]|jgi:HAMP domain-containing protein|nr:hypothetical protein [Polyangiaceae bacterium]
MPSLDLLPVLGALLLILLLALLFRVLGPQLFASPRLQRAIGAFSQGDMAGARSILDELERSFWHRSVRVNIAYLRGLIAFHEGDLPGARRWLDQALSYPLGFLMRVNGIVLRVSARAFRSTVAALQGDRATAEQDARRVDHDADGQIDSPALVALTRALLLLQGGQKDALRSHLRKHRQLLLAAPISMRPLVRALVRPWSLPETSAYRAQGDQVSLPEDPATAWILSIAPSLAPLLLQPPLDEDDRPATPPLPAAPPQVKLPDLTAARKKGPILLRKLGLVLGLSVVTFALVFPLVQLLTKPPVGPAARSYDGPSPLPPELSLLAFFAIGGIFVLSFWVGNRRVRSRQQKLNRADLAVALGDMENAIPTFRKLLLDDMAIFRAAGAQRLGHIANLHGHHQEAIAWSNLALDHLKKVPVGSDMLRHLLLGEKASALLLDGQPEEARRQLTQIKPNSSMFLPTLQFSFDLLDFLRQGDLPAAGALARKRSSTLLLPLPTELIADLTQLLTEPSPSRTQVAALLHEVSLDPLTEAWIHRAAPALLAQARKLVA